MRYNPDRFVTSTVTLTRAELLDIEDAICRALEFIEDDRDLSSARHKVLRALDMDDAGEPTPTTGDQLATLPGLVKPTGQLDLDIDELADLQQLIMAARDGTEHQLGEPALARLWRKLGSAFKAEDLAAHGKPAARMLR